MSPQSGALSIELSDAGIKTGLSFTLLVLVSVVYNTYSLILDFIFVGLCWGWDVGWLWSTTGTPTCKFMGPCINAKQCKTWLHDLIFFPNAHYQHADDTLTWTSILLTYWKSTLCYRVIKNISKWVIYRPNWYIKKSHKVYNWWSLMKKHKHFFL